MSFVPMCIHIDLSNIQKPLFSYNESYIKQKGGISRLFLNNTILIGEENNLISFLPASYSLHLPCSLC